MFAKLTEHSGLTGQLATIHRIEILFTKLREYLFTSGKPLLWRHPGSRDKYRCFLLYSLHNCKCSRVSFRPLNRGIVRGGNGDRDGAIADYTRAIELDPRLAELSTRLEAVDKFPALLTALEDTLKRQILNLAEKLKVVRTCTELVNESQAEADPFGAPPPGDEDAPF